MLRKNIYPYEYLDSWQRFNETSFPDKNEFYSNLTMENITDANYKHARIVQEDFGILNLGECHDLYMHGASLWSFIRTTNIRNLSFKLFFDTRVSMASMAEKDRSRYRIADRCPYATNGRQKHQRWNSSYFTSLRKSQQKYMKDYDPNKESSYYMYWDFNNLYG